MWDGQGVAVGMVGAEGEPTTPHTHSLYRPASLPQPLSQCGGELSARETRAPPCYPSLCVVVFVVAWVLLCRSV